MKKNFCIVDADYYPNITKNLIKGALKVLKKNKIKSFKVILTTGVFEIPIIISKNIRKYDAFIALGCVIKGKTPHFNYISKATINALMHLSISFNKPIGNGILTCLNKKQALIRSNPLKKDKGGESAKATFSVLKT